MSVIHKFVTVITPLEADWRLASDHKMPLPAAFFLEFNAKRSHSK